MTWLLFFSVLCQPTFQFPKERHLNYVQYLGTIPKLEAFTMCAWISPNSDSGVAEGVIASNCNDPTTNCNHLMVAITTKGTILYIHISHQTSRHLPIQPVEARTHICIILSKESRNVQVYFNATNMKSLREWDSPALIIGNGVLILGQDQDKNAPAKGLPGIPKNRHQAFHGKIEGFYMWDRPLNESGIMSVYNYSCYPVTGKIVSFNSSNFQISGDVPIRNGEAHCPDP